MTAAAEAGIDVRNMRGLPGGAGGTAGRIFPDLELHSGGERRLLPNEVDGGADAAAAGDGGAAASSPAASASSRGDAFLISKMREMHHRLRTSAFHVRPSGEGVPDVERYAPSSSSSSSAAAREDGGVDRLVGRKRTRGEGGGAYVPEELCVTGAVRRGSDAATSRAATLRALNLAELAAKIRSDGVGVGGADALDEDGNRRRQGGIDGEGGEEDGEEYAAIEDGEESDGADYAANYYESEGDESKGSDGEPTF